MSKFQCKVLFLSRIPNLKHLKHFRKLTDVANTKEPGINSLASSFDLHQILGQLTSQIVKTTASCIDLIFIPHIKVAVLFSVAAAITDKRTQNLIFIFADMLIISYSLLNKKEPWHWIQANLNCTEKVLIRFLLFLESHYM